MFARAPSILSRSCRSLKISARNVNYSTANMQQQKSFIPKEALETIQAKIAKDIAASGGRPPVPESAVASSGELIAEKVVTGLFLTGCAYGMYALTSDLSPDPAYVAASQMPMKLWQRARYRAMSLYKGMIDPDTDHLLPDPFPQNHAFYKPLTLVIELDKTLVHSSWSKDHGWKIVKRPFADQFLAYLAQFYEIVLFTSQPPSYGIPIIEKLDPLGAIMYKLYRDSTVYDIETGDHIKDLSLLNRDLKRVVVMDPDAKHYDRTQPDNMIELKKWEGDMNDTYLLDIIPFLEALAMSGHGDVRKILASHRGRDIPSTFAANLAQLHKSQREQHEKKHRIAEASQNQQGWLSYVGTGLLSVVGMGGSNLGHAAPMPDEKDIAMQQAQHYANAMKELDAHKKAVEEQQKAQLEEHERIMKKMSSVKVTLWDVITLGPDGAALKHADPETRAFIEANMALQKLQQEQQQQPAQ